LEKKDDDNDDNDNGDKKVPTSTIECREMAPGSCQTVFYILTSLAGAGKSNLSYHSNFAAKLY